MNEHDDEQKKLRDAIRIIELQRRIMLEAHSSLEIVDSLGRIIKYLDALSPSEAARVISGLSWRPDHKAKMAEEILASSTMKLDEVEQLLSDDKVTKKRLEAIAVGRFNVPVGSLRSIGNMERLKDKIATLARNERAHSTISSVAKDQNKR